MRPVGFLLDENAPHAIRDQLLRRHPTLQVLAIGDEFAPPLGTPDPDILTWLEREGYCLVTYNRATIPGHVSDHLMAEHHVAGIFVVRPNVPVGTVIVALSVVWTSDDWDRCADRVTFVPA